MLSVEDLRVPFGSYVVVAMPAPNAKPDLTVVGSITLANPRINDFSPNKSYYGGVCGDSGEQGGEMNGCLVGRPGRPI